MLNETKLEDIVIKFGKQTILALIETQTILQLMVKKEIVTPEEVNITRNIVRNQPKYAEAMQAFDNKTDNINESIKFEEIFLKKLQGKELTHDEDNYLREVADKL